MADETLHPELRDQPAWWIDALRRRVIEAEDEKNPETAPIDHHDVVAAALLHPEKFEVLVQLKGGA